MMAVTVIAIILQRNLYSVVVLASIYSFLMATVLVALDAVDVAMTEASVGAGISTVLMLAALHLTKVEEARPKHTPILPLFVSAGTAAMLIYGTVGLPPFGHPDTPVNSHVGHDYIARTLPETGIPNAVTSVLASYRGLDTLGEVMVIFTAGIGVLLLLKRTIPGGRG